jgi:YesN/AraC family two-component response regulator
MTEKLKVLIVDDSRSVLAQLGGLIADLDFAEVVGSARDGADAIRMAAELEPDLVLMDVVMPRMDGLAALRVLAARFPDLSVAMLSSVGGRRSTAEEAFRLGAMQVLGKPFEKHAILALLESIKPGGRGSRPS